MARIRLLSDAVTALRVADGDDQCLAYVQEAH